MYTPLGKDTVSVKHWIEAGSHGDTCTGARVCGAHDCQS